MKFKTIVSLALLSIGIYLGIFIQYDSTLLKIIGSISAGLIVSVGLFVWRSNFGFALVTPDIQKRQIVSSKEETEEMSTGKSPVFSIEAFLHEKEGLVINVKKSTILSARQVKDILSQVMEAIEKEEKEENDK